MRTKRAAFIAGLILTGMVIGFLIGSAVYAGGGEPGSAADPLVARSYVDEHMASYVANLEKKVAELSSRALQLEAALAQLQKQVGLTPIKPGEAVSGSGTGTGSSGNGSSGTGISGSGSSSTGSTGSQTGGFKPGQKLYILPENSAVNLRKGPGTNYEKVGTAVRGSGCEPMTVLSRSGDWFQVKLADGRTGWVAGWLVTAS